ncbi:MAG: VWA domain-containing protein [Burkholderiales bacterium]
MSMRILLSALALAVALGGCGAEVNRNHAVYLLVDSSGSYAKEVGKVQAVVNFVLGSLNPGDSMAVARVKSRSFTEKDIVAKVSLVQDPLQVTSQKRAFSEKVGEFTRTTEQAGGSRYTDLTGGIMQAAEFLNETGAGRKTIIVFSDMEEDLDPKAVRDFPIRLDGMRIVAINVVKLDADNVDPRRYVGRLEWWEKRTREAGASEWRVVNDMQHLDRIFGKRG